MKRSDAVEFPREGRELGRERLGREVPLEEPVLEEEERDEAVLGRELGPTPACLEERLLHGDGHGRVSLLDVVLVVRLHDLKDRGAGAPAYQQDCGHGSEALEQRTCPVCSGSTRWRGSSRS